MDVYDSLLGEHLALNSPNVQLSGRAVHVATDALVGILHPQLPVAPCVPVESYEPVDAVAADDWPVKLGLLRLVNVPCGLGTYDELADRDRKVGPDHGHPVIFAPAE